MTSMYIKFVVPIGNHSLSLIWLQFLSTLASTKWKAVENRTKNIEFSNIQTSNDCLLRFGLMIKGTPSNSMWPPSVPSVPVCVSGGGFGAVREGVGSL